MSMTDPVADMLTRIRNAVQAHHEAVQMPGSKLKKRIAHILKEEGYVDDYEWKDEGPQGSLHIRLKWLEEQSAIEGLRRVSRPGQRCYASCSKIPKVRNGLGVAVLSTSRGVLSDQAARDASVGGEVLCEVW